MIRPLTVEDAMISYKWRNDPEVWKFTGNKPDHLISYEDELHWIIETLSRNNEKRFAIIADDYYVGNVQLTDIKRDQATYHIFIGDKLFWGKGVAYEATKLIISYAFETLKLKAVTLKVIKEHERAINLYIKVGFRKIYLDGDFLTMTISRKHSFEGLRRRRRTRTI